MLYICTMFRMISWASPCSNFESVELLTTVDSHLNNIQKVGGQLKDWLLRNYLFFYTPAGRRTCVFFSDPIKDLITYTREKSGLIFLLIKNRPFEDFGILVFGCNKGPNEFAAPKNV